ncbi:unnamed protein product [Urochloa humidicola]
MARTPSDLISNDPLTNLLYAAHKALSYTLVLALVLAVCSVPVFFLLNVNDEAQYAAVGLAAFQGMNNATADGHTVSPSFNILVRATNRNTFRTWCHDRGEATVYYSGAAIATGRVPGFCVKRRSADNFTVVVRGEGLRLSDDLRGRLGSQWRNGTAKVLLDMKLHYYPNYFFLPTLSSPGTSSISQQLMLGDTSEVPINV